MLLAVLAQLLIAVTCAPAAMAAPAMPGSHQGMMDGQDHGAPPAHQGAAQACHHCLLPPPVPAQAPTIFAEAAVQPTAAPQPAVAPVPALRPCGAPMPSRGPPALT